MIVRWKVVALLVTMIASLTTASPSPPPKCITDLISSESGARAHLPAPHVVPASGPVGTSVTIRGGGFPPGARVILAGVYAENRCSIEGLGDQFLGTARADGRGSYSASLAWPGTFDPVLGRNQMPSMRLPSGPYYVFALPCAERAACSFTAGTLPGGPFVLGARRGARAAPIAGAVAGALVLVVGLVRWRRMTARSR